MKLFSEYGKTTEIDDYQIYLKSLEKISDLKTHQNKIARFKFSGSGEEFNLKRTRINSANYMIPTISGTYEKKTKTLNLKIIYQRVWLFIVLPFVWLLGALVLLDDWIIAVFLIVLGTFLTGTGIFLRLIKEKKVIIHEIEVLSKMPGTKKL